MHRVRIIPFFHRPNVSLFPLGSRLQRHRPLRENEGLAGSLCIPRPVNYGQRGAVALGAEREHELSLRVAKEQEQGRGSMKETSNNNKERMQKTIEKKWTVVGTIE